MLRLFLSHLGGEAIRTFALVIAPDLPPLACLAIGIAGGILIEAVLLVAPSAQQSNHQRGE